MMVASLKLSVDGIWSILGLVSLQLTWSKIQGPPSAGLYMSLKNNVSRPFDVCVHFDRADLV